ncbi:L-iditol 2-dehydrogenase [Candidatus Haliotispira prima]|uniref:L-iditol 2-dehydrogenase n=1 Tax=Candidatus Haliotispira prima TaxID=3034016 RepID=A0ABY8MGG5_9SPIO|nr:L-iditol 2-dehydrogenase [Candidatus Haliotispira prima]
MGKLEQKVAIVTGGGSGIGRAISLRYAKEGACVVIADLNEKNVQKVAGEIENLGAKALPLTLDICDMSEVEALSEKAVKHFGKVDILVNNAGVGKIIPFFETTEQDWDMMFNVNCKGLLWCSQVVAKQMIAQGHGGKIINLASQAGRRGESLVLAYCASKAAVISMNQSMALALAEHKINVNAIAPGMVDTPFWDEVDRQFAKIHGWKVGEPKKKFSEAIPLGRMEQPEDLTGMAVFLASGDSDYITQQCYNVDGGNWPS